MNSSSTYTNVEVVLDRETPVSFECKGCGPIKSGILKRVNGETFDGSVQLQFYDMPLKIWV
jgi:hypothetical protein